MHLIDSFCITSLVQMCIKFPTQKKTRKYIKLSNWSINLPHIDLYPWHSDPNRPLTSINNLIISPVINNSFLNNTKSDSKNLGNAQSDFKLLGGIVRLHHVACAWSPSREQSKFNSNYMACEEMLKVERIKSIIWAYWCHTSPLTSNAFLIHVSPDFDREIIYYF